MSINSRKNDPSETAGFLAACVAGLDSIAKKQFASDDDLYQKLMAFQVKEFLNAFQSAKRNVFPLLSSFQQNAPVRHAGVSGTSYHEVVWKLAKKQFRAMFFRLEPERYLRCIESALPLNVYFEGDEISVESIINNWNVVAGDLSEIFAGTEQIDGEFLRAGIEVERMQLVADGPCGNYQWRHDGVVTEATMQVGAWKMVKHLWEQADRTASFDELKVPVYADVEHIADERAFGSMRREANKFFRNNGIPWKAALKNATVCLNPEKIITARAK